MAMLIYQCEGFVDGWSFTIALLAIAHLDHSQSSQLQVGYVSCFFKLPFVFRSTSHHSLGYVSGVESSHSVLQAKHKSLKTQVSLT